MSKVRTHPITADVLAAEMGVCKKLVYRLARERALPSFRLGRLLRFDPVAVAEFMRSGGAPPVKRRRAK